MNDDDWTPSDENIRGAFIFALEKGYGFIGEPEGAKALFDRWLAAHDAATVEQERAAAVAHLRKWSTQEEGWECFGYCDPPQIVDNIATAIEAGEHRTERSKT